MGLGSEKGAEGSRTVAVLLDYFAFHKDIVICL
jgi:hypothetical protein